jgi:SAM-dependent methyltransferase
VDVGDTIIRKVLEIVECSGIQTPIVVDMGCGSAWAADSLREKSFRGRYVGLDVNPHFVEHGQRKFAQEPGYCFEKVDFEQDYNLGFLADIVLNAFAFFELTELERPMYNASKMLKPGGRLITVTIDKTYLIMALSRSWKELRANLKRYQEIEGTKYGFQSIDLGNHASANLEYPSVLYSVEDFLRAANASGLVFESYKEFVYTAKPIPKIYLMMQFRKVI